MAVGFFITILASLFFFSFLWGFKRLPGESWQFLASVPCKKGTDGIWKGVNLTYYGLFSAHACLLSVLVIMILLGSLSFPLAGILAIVGSVIVICFPFAKIMARIVEKNKNTFTVGGASFLGIILAPWVIHISSIILKQWTDFTVNTMIILSALSIGYTIGEAFGRLACISFGCCYGKEVAQLSPPFRALFIRMGFTFKGKTKKISYAHNLDEKKVVPIQAITAIIYALFGVFGVWLFFRSSYTSAFLTTLVVTQIWRILSEFLRADYRGGGRLSSYQIMSLFAVFYGIFIAFTFHTHVASSHNIIAGLRTLWNPAIILLLQGLWVAVFLFTGRSKVTDASLSFHVIKEEI